MLLQSGSVLKGQYRIDALIGGGGMAMVYRAFDLNLQRVCAIKQNLDTSPQAQQQFHTEAILLANLNHPHLSRVTDHFLDTAGQQYLVMDFVEGENLESLVARGGSLSEAQALVWMQGVLDAAAYCHSRRVIHRDIKPANLVKCQAEDKVVLVDFGIAKQEVTGGMTLPGARAATPSYAPPEQYSGRTDERSDIYSLGATFYYLLTGQSPPDARLVAAGVETLASPRAFNRHIRPATERAVLRAMATRVGDRPQTVAELRALLGAGSQSGVVATGPRPTKGSSKKTPLWVVAGTMTVAVLILLAFALNGLSGNGGTPTPPSETMPTITRTTIPVPVVAPVATRVATPELAFSPETIEVLFATPSPALTEETLQPDDAPGSTAELGRRFATSTPIQTTQEPPTPEPPTLTPTKEATVARPTTVAPTQTKAPERILSIPELLNPLDGETGFDLVSLAWRAPGLGPGEKFQVRLVRNRDAQDWLFDTQDFTLPFVFDDRPDIFNEPGDFLWSVRIVDTFRNREGPFSQQWRFKFERRNNDEPQDTPEPVPTAR